MSKPLADPVDAKRLAADGAVLERRYTLADFPRLADVLVSPAGDVAVRVAFLTLAEGVVGCELDVQAAPLLRCQRCLEPCTIEVDSSTRLALVGSDAEAQQVPEGFEPVVTDAARLALHELVEDELLLSLPIVPRHDDSDACSPRAAGEPLHETRAEGEAQDLRRPFANLKDLLKH